MPRQRRHLVPLVVASLAALLLAAGCGGQDEPATATAPKPLTTVSVALDWTPNTNHSGLYVADRLGLYRDAGIRLKVIPYATTLPETLVSRGRADFGVSYQAGVSYARAAGGDVVSVLAPVQRNAFEIGVAANREDLQRPRDLDGRTYAGFGVPDEVPALQQVIRADGGRGEFKDVTLSTSAYEAVYDRRADFTIPAATWQVIEARLAGKPMRTFRFEDYGFPEQYSTLLVSSAKFLQDDPDLARRFLKATLEGYEVADEDPERAAQLLLEANPTTLKNPELVNASAKLMAQDGWLRDPDGEVSGTQAAERWNAYGRFLAENDLLAGKDGKPLPAEPDWTTYYTNAYLPESEG
jgi:ABC-type nitrate/sulfonate/bicarbonate transport system substrate-binding protein